MYKCTNCGQELKASDTVCHVCESELERRDFQLTNLNAGRFEKPNKACPHCCKLFAHSALHYSFRFRRKSRFTVSFLDIRCPLCEQPINSKYAKLHCGFIALVAFTFIGAKTISPFCLALLPPILIYFYKKLKNTSNDPYEYTKPNGNKPS